MKKMIDAFNSVAIASVADAVDPIPHSKQVELALKNSNIN